MQAGQGLSCSPALLHHHSHEFGRSHPQRDNRSLSPTGFCWRLLHPAEGLGKRQGGKCSSLLKILHGKATRKIRAWKCKEWGDRKGHKGPCFPPHALDILILTGRGNVGSAGEQHSPSVPQEHPPLLWECAPMEKPNSTCTIKEHPY